MDSTLKHDIYKIPRTAMALAAGTGTRMMPLTEHTPKPCLKVCDKTIIDWVLDYLAEAGVKQTVVNIHHLHEIVEQHLAQRSNPQVTTIFEEVLLETGGGLKNALPLLGDEPFYVMNTDVIWTENPEAEQSALHKLATAWDDESMDLLLMLQPKENGHFFEGVGDYHLNNNGTLRLTNRAEHEKAPYYFNGLRIVHPRLFNGSKDASTPWSFLELMKKAEANGRLFGVIHDGESFHIGRPESLIKANEILSQRTAKTECHQKYLP